MHLPRRRSILTQPNTLFQATTPVAVLLASWIMGVSPLNLKTLGNVSFIVLGVIIASYGEIKFVMIGFLFQLAGVAFEATRLVMVQKLLSSAEFKMDPLVSLYYFAPACAVMNGIVSLFIEVPHMTWADVEKVGYLVFLLNALVAFALNVSVVFLVRTSPASICEYWLTSNSPIDRQDFRPRHDPLRCTQGYPPRCCIHDETSFFSSFEDKCCFRLGSFFFFFFCNACQCV